MKLVLLVDGKEVGEFELGQGSNLIGRWDPVTKSFPEIDLEDFDTEALVSRRHAVLSLRDEGISLEDLGSTNGTFLSGGKKLEAGTFAPLLPNAEFFVGNLRLKLLA